MMVELQDMRWTIIASQHRSLRQAAETLKVRQSTLGRRLRDMEYRLGAELFERTNGGTRPTVVGREFLQTARRIVEETDAALAKLRTRCRGESRRLTIGVYTSFSIGNLRATLTEHRRRFPDVDVHTVDGGHDKLLGELAANVIDVAIMTTCCPTWDDRMLSLWSERLILALPQQHPLSDHAIIYWSELATERVLVPQSGPGLELMKGINLGMHQLNQVRSEL